MLLRPNFWVVNARCLLEGWPLWLVPSWAPSALLEGRPLLLPLLAPFLVLLLPAIVLQEGKPLGRPASGPERYGILPRAPSLRQLPASGPEWCGILPILALLQQLPLRSGRYSRYGI